MEGWRDGGCAWWSLFLSVPHSLCHSFPDKVWTGGEVAGIVFLAEAGEGAADWVIFRIIGEVQDNQGFALSGEGNGGFAVVGDVRLVGNDPSVGLVFFPGKGDLAAIVDFYGVFRNEVRGEMDEAGLVCVDMDKDAIGLLAY